MENTTPEISRRIRENLTVTLIVSRSEPLRGSPGQLRSNSQVSGVAACMRYTLNRPAISSVPKATPGFKRHQRELYSKAVDHSRLHRLHFCLFTISKSSSRVFVHIIGSAFPGSPGVKNGTFFRP